MGEGAIVKPNRPSKSALGPAARRRSASFFLGTRLSDVSESADLASARAESAERQGGTLSVDAGGGALVRRYFSF